MERTGESAQNTEWMKRGECRPDGGIPAEIFFPSDGLSVEVARAICATCDVKRQCLEYALFNQIDHGVWGGASERERRRINKARRKHSIEQ
jgi:WhiB family redox-sensing transcriptional regulator